MTAIDHCTAGRPVLTDSLMLLHACNYIKNYMDGNKSPETRFIKCMHTVV